MRIKLAGSVVSAGSTKNLFLSFSGSFRMAGESSRSVDGQDDANASFIEIQEHGDKKFSEVIAGMIENVDPPPESSPRHCCIYKVSDHIRQSNEEAYTPQVISIGPFHRNNPRLQTMERFKQRYLKSFMERAPKMNLEDLASTIRGAEKSVRECYSERIPLGSDDFVKMILLDAIFIIEFFWRNWTAIWIENDRRMLTSLLSNRGQLDLILLENQLPFFIIEKIYETAFPSLSKEGHPFIDLTFRQFEYYNVQKNTPRDFWSSEILHFTDLVRHFCMPPPERRQLIYQKIKAKMPSATQLAKVGLKFKMRKSTYCSPLELKYTNGVLEIPPFQLDSTTEIYAQNLVPFEQSHYREDPYITNYYFLLFLLIRSWKDVNFLVQKMILKLEDSADDMDAIPVLSKISKYYIDGSGMNNYYSQLAEESNGKSSYFEMNSDYHQIAEAMNQFYTARARLTYLLIMMHILKDEYFYNPWRGVATIGGILLLLLTIIQTVCALISVKNWE